MLPRQGHAFHAMESSRKGDGFILFASAKRTKKQLLGRAKSCQWQVFVRRRPPKQGELRTDVSKATMFQGVDYVLRPRFKTLRKNFFVTFPAFVSKPVCSATHFFGCFEPVRKGYCSADARLMFFGKGLPHCKLTGASHI